MAMSAFEYPKKKKMSFKRIENAVDKYVDDNTFTIEIKDESGKDLAIEFKRFVSPIQLGSLLRQASTTSIIRDTESGGMIFDAPSLQLSVHNFLILVMSNLEAPTVVENGEASLDVDKLGVYGTYFRCVSEDYDTVFTNLYMECKKVIDAKLKNYERMMDSVLNSMTAETKTEAVPTDPSEVFASILKTLSSSEPGIELLSKIVDVFPQFFQSAQEELEDEEVSTKQ